MPFIMRRICHSQIRLGDEFSKVIFHEIRTMNVVCIERRRPSLTLFLPRSYSFMPQGKKMAELSNTRTEGLSKAYRRIEKAWGDEI